jgi:NAD(P)-dependent dehydrogenase (short-subunit alcohol dehydrogenase family)
MRHEGKTMVVTGAAGAIGFATSEILAREGAKVMLVDIAAVRLADCTAKLKAGGHDVIGHVADCADEAQVEGYARAAIDAWGRIDGFFNNAGIARRGSWWSLPASTSSGVSITPGITQFTRTPFCATSLAAVRVRPTAPCLAAL